MSVGADTARPPKWLVWLGATRPKTLVAAAVPVVVGHALAVQAGSARLGLTFAAFLGAFFIQVGTNFFNDHADFNRGADTDLRLGPARAAQKGWLTPRELLVGTWLVFGLACLAGLPLVWAAGWPILIVGVISILCGLAYTGGPIPLAYHGLGDIFVLLFFGIVAVGGTYFVHGHAITADVLLLGVAVGAWSTAILVVNNLRDRVTDAAVGKRTLAVRFGAAFSRVQYALLVLAGTGLAAWVTHHWLPLVALPLFVATTTQVVRRDGRDLNVMLGATAGMMVLATGLTVGALFL